MKTEKNGPFIVQIDFNRVLSISSNSIPPLPCLGMWVDTLSTCWLKAYVIKKSWPCSECREKSLLPDERGESESQTGFANQCDTSISYQQWHTDPLNTVFHKTQTHEKPVSWDLREKNLTNFSRLSIPVWDFHACLNS